MREVVVLDLQKSSSEFSYAVKLRGRRGDSRSLKRTFQITDSGNPVDLSDKTVTFLAYNAGKNIIMEPVPVQDISGQFSYSFPDAVVAVSGDVTMAYFRVEKDGEWTGSTNQIFIEVLDDVSLTNDVTGDYVPLLDQIMEAAEELAMNAGSIVSEASGVINDCSIASDEANAAAAYARETAANTARSLQETMGEFVSGFMVEYSDLTQDCKDKIALVASSGVVFATREEIDEAFEKEILPVIASGGAGITKLTEDDFGWALNRIFG